ncbi:hypothetical protein [Butyrivibrio fibrisolvens]|uniref:hypothetical protein n=1 Tax=Butyrivibrio fibrisolvens TaxID=831 RepID=UPI000420305C|nr:hypothetical protein [Butyrivibrio fibrisolvens]
MPRNKVKTIPVDKKIFMYILKKKNSSIRKLGASEEVLFTEKTIRRALNKGEMRPILVKQIAKLLNIDSSILTGEKIKKNAHDYKDEKLALSCLSHIEDFPYFDEEQRELLIIKEDGYFEYGGMKETMKRLLSLFDVSYSQYEEFDFETQYNFKHELFDNMAPIIRKYFKKNAYGNDDPFAFESIIFNLEQAKEHHDDLEYADTVLRQQFIENTPKGLSKNDIQKMTSQDILNLYTELQLEECFDDIDTSSLDL